jgi:membrane-bound lytic murein transglycosylase B
MPAGSLARPIAADSSAALHSGADTPLPLMPEPQPSPPRRARAARAALALALGVVALAPATPARAENPAADPAAPAAPTAPIAPPSPDLPGLPATSIELAQVEVGGADFERARSSYREVDARHAAAQTARHELDHTASVLAQRLGELEVTRASADARAAALTARLGAVERAIQELAVETFVAGGEDERLNAAVASETPAINEAEKRDVLGGLSMDVLLTERAAYRARIDEAKERASTATADLAQARKALDALRGDRPESLDEELGAAKRVATERVTYEEARVLAIVEGVEFPLVALDAYYRAAGATAEERPRCGVEWWGVAGISKVEGRHGTYGGAELLPNGDTSKRIVGIQLNGTKDTAVIADTDGGALDGDPGYDRAVGPMQFIPQTWKRFAADGNEDGTTSPWNLYDAALAAANYLCTASSGLSDDPGLRRAYFAYNHSELYVRSVLDYARGYERALEVPEPES